ncbi:ergothioneine biosynthesis protein EgtB [Dictyobacter sp. S3.2.2.5]|uniref:Ergothioneine biosynthesis protein EgtB n=1 Tax=Dictyobacter halimunensis TaxID=3026934 RepID=A0ABQ6FRC9_9CHLR|nr:ergothioneine biosynthesis protein EgtB [Dictyobacter sp. S3.2.2.5]
MAKNIQDRPVLEQSSPRQALLEDYLRVRRFSEQLCVPLVTEDYVIQSMPDVSPTRWHLAHTSWFFETFVLSSYTPDYTSPHPQYAYLFNSYYNSVGERHCRPKRGLISRPTVQETYAYRRYVDDCVSDFLSTCTDETLVKAAPVVTLGIHHEQQHQELMVTDIKHVLSCNPLHPVYQKQALSSATPPPALSWISYSEQLAWIGYDGDGFFYDNEGPYHREFVDAYQLGSRLITNGEYLQFIEDGGYQNPLLWLSSGWNTVQGEQWQAPLYWEKHDGQWMMMTLSGLRPVEPAEPVCHVSYYEADAYARWADARLATEAEWELASRQVPIEGNFVENQQFHPVPLEKAVDAIKPEQMYGDVWEWTQSAYLPYRGYRPAPGALGEYNGKFMCNQFVLRGGSCATSITHIRPTYRNFFPPDARWQFIGIRLAREV